MQNCQNKKYLKIKVVLEIKCQSQAAMSFTNYHEAKKFFNKSKFSKHKVAVKVEKY